MSEVSTRAWTRPHDWAEVVIGVVAALSPLWLSTSNAAMWTMVVLGALVAIDGLVSLGAPGAVYGEGIQIVLGVLLFIAPWVIGYTEMNGASWTSWVAGALTIIASVAAMPVAQAAHRTAGQH
ncbi:SPW repeat domain-containing protein [Amycolatopsis saalfeldensis]|uniref:SPW repeat-containing protein n=1 Tax=Amycolatopsis saalfeldensis TaxID=394193 RepID=A0A1H8YDS4_9PSEU|nr:SPW repeat protein [Amycolatopsis saalfeldensis]SEP50289.1 SPW repeat-containing protein [Amycolatopsis saalfeldensis]